MLSKQIEGAQKRVEEQNFVSRKNVLKYDDVMNIQRMVIYEQRQRVLEGEDLSEEIKGWADEVVEAIVYSHTEGDHAEDWDLQGLLGAMNGLYESQVTPEELASQPWTREELIEEFQEDAQDAYAAKEEELGPELMREIERFLMLQIVDSRWREHLDVMEYLREGIHLRAMAQKDPLSEYRSEGHAMFTELSENIREEVLRHLFHVQVDPAEQPTLEPARANRGGNENLTYEHESIAGSDAILAAGAAGGMEAATATAQAPARHEQRVATEWDTVGRNDPCPCGSGKKYKKCHGA